MITFRVAMHPQGKAVVVLGKSKNIYIYKLRPDATDDETRLKNKLFQTLNLNFYDIWITIDDSVAEPPRKKARK
jgi:hypothetical protein